MLSNPMNNWYTDLADIYRVKVDSTSGFDDHDRVLIRQGMPCRIFRSSNPNTKMTPTYPSVTPTDMLACSTSEDIQAGDRVHVRRGARITPNGDLTIYFAGSPQNYFEPFGGARPRIDHKEVPLSGEHKVSEGVVEDGVRSGGSTANIGTASEGRESPGNSDSLPKGIYYQSGGSSDETNSAK